MFFVPSILQLAAYNTIHVLCLSTGNYAGLGEIRVKELEKSCEVLQIEPPTTLNESRLQDGA
jgi:N-acetylglucosaminylphosphatidylinositol deacetylase